MKEVTKRLISNETLQEISIKLKDAANRSAAKISNETWQERFIWLEKAAKRYAAKNQVKHHQKEIIDLKNMILSREKAKTTPGKKKQNGKVWPPQTRLTINEANG
jgi:hypothetical protein